MRLPMSYHLRSDIACSAKNPAPFILEAYKNCFLEKKKKENIFKLRAAAVCGA